MAFAAFGNPRALSGEKATQRGRNHMQKNMP
jgi:hypothetical protein